MDYQCPAGVRAGTGLQTRLSADARPLAWCFTQFFMSCMAEQGHGDNQMFNTQPGDTEAAS